MIEKIIYSEAHENVLSVLVEMKKSIDRYAEREGCNEQWLRQQRNWLIDIGSYVKVVQNIVGEMDQKESEYYQAGYQAAMKKLSKETPNYHFKGFGDKEAERAYHNDQQKNKWYDHY